MAERGCDTQRGKRETQEVELGQEMLLGLVL